MSAVRRDSLADVLARRIRTLISSGTLAEGDRLPPILEMARRFSVGAPTVREAIRKLETFGVVEVRHGSGVYVSAGRERLVLATPGLVVAKNDRVLADLMEARIPLEVHAVAGAVANATAEQLDAIDWLVTTASTGPLDDRAASDADAMFHRQLALASGNTILVQMLDALRQLLTDEGRVIDWGPMIRDRDMCAHAAILDAITQRDASLARERMVAHLESVREAVALRAPFAARGDPLGAAGVPEEDTDSVDRTDETDRSEGGTRPRPEPVR
jgi:GntR family transcriptional repressor for pyruvate dehydrogenase complex